MKQKYRNLLKLRYLRVFEVFLNSFYRVLHAEREGNGLLCKIIKELYQIISKIIEQQKVTDMI